MMSDRPKGETASHRSSSWIALMIGNSRLHWAIFTDQTLQYTWDTTHLTDEAIAPLMHAPPDWRLFSQGVTVPPAVQAIPAPDLWIASVVPTQTALWQAYPHAHLLTLTDIPLQGLYPTLGIDRALALWGAIAQWGAPALVIDAGTALTFTGADSDQQLVGGAILPGLQLQMRSLSQHTAALPSVTSQLTDLPTRWATNTPDAIRSGVLYSTLASIREFTAAWLQQFPTHAIALTGGDSALLHHALQILYPDLDTQLDWEPNLVLKGIATVRQCKG